MLGKNMPKYLSFGKNRPCMSLAFKFENLRDLLFKRNLIKNCLKFLVEIKNNSFDQIQMEELNLFRNNLLIVQRYLEDDFTKNMNASELKRNRDAQLIIEMRKIANSLINLSKSLAFQKTYLLKQIMSSIEKIDHLLTESISLFPDLNIWMLCKNKPVGVCTIKSHDVIWSFEDSKRGLICNKFVYIDKKVNRLKN